MENMSKKYIYKVNMKGISLIILVMTIIVALILLTTIVISTRNTIENTNVVTFAKDLTEIRQATENYYIANNLMPSLDNSTVMSKDQLIEISRAQNILIDELTENNDLDSEFYTIDLAKINVTKSSYGTKKFGENDIFVIAYPSMIVYYPHGLDAKGTTYFSITSKISKITIIPQNQVGSYTTTVTSSNGIKVTQTTGWTNKMGVNIEANMDVGETLFMSVSGDPNRLITTIAGKNAFGFNLLSSIVSNTETIKVPTLTLAEANYIELGTKPSSERYVDILKYKNSEIIGKVRINLSNFSKNIPAVTTATILSSPTFNTTQVTLTNSESGIKEVRYEYLKKYAEDGTIQNYYNGISDFDATYMKDTPKKATITNGLIAKISAPKNVQSVIIAIIDKAGNIKLQTIDIAPRLYIGYTLNSSTALSLQLTANMYSLNGIKSITFSKSIDGTNFTDEQSYTLNTTTNGTTTKQCTPFSGLTGNTVYIKMVAINYDNSITETRIVKVSLTTVALPANKPVLATGMTAKSWNGSSWVTVASPDTDTTWYNYDTTNKQWANAQTADGSMWVWIPRYEYKIPTPHSSTAQTIDVNFLSNLSTTTTSGYIVHPGFTFGSTELTGIWVAKFEASGTISAVDSKPGVASLRTINVDGVFTACRNMETTNGTRYGWGTSGTGIDTHLMKNIEWGAVAYLTQSLYGKNSEVWINPNSSFLTGQAGTSVNSAGTATTYAYDNATYGINASTTGNVTGVYDMCGGAYEYTAAYVNNGNANLTTNGFSLVNAASQYKDVYVSSGDTDVGNYTANSSKVGDAMYETSSSYTGTTSWYSESSYIPYGANAFFHRGAVYSVSTNAGLFNFNYYSGIANLNFGFRPVLSVSGSL